MLCSSDLTVIKRLWACNIFWRILIYRIPFFLVCFLVFFLFTVAFFEKAKKKDREEDLGCSGHV